MRWFRRESETTEHEYSQERLSAYLDEELAPGERGRVDHHLVGCSQCRCDLDNLRRTVQWTMSLPVVPCPRSFMVPVPAPAKRVQRVQRVWAMPVLQGATALVAVLFLLAVVGEAFLPGAHPALAPAPAAVEREAAASAAGQAVESEVESVQLMVAEAPAEATAVPEARVVAETVVVESVQDQAAAAASAAPPGMGIGGEGAEAQPPPAATDLAPKALVGAAGSSVLPTATPWPTPTIEPSATPPSTAEPEPTETACPTATLVPTVALAPTLVAAVNEGADAEPQGEVGVAEAVVQPQPLGWLTAVAIALGVAFVVLGTLTVILMIRRIRRA